VGHPGTLAPRRAGSIVTDFERGRSYHPLVTSGLHRYYNSRDLHFITCSCYRRKPVLGSASRRDLFLKILENARRNYRFVVHGYVVMPEHFHMLITEPEVGDPSVVMKVIKERFSRALHKAEDRDFQVWQKRFYDFNVWSDGKRIEKLRYMHRNPVKRGLVDSPEMRCRKWTGHIATCGLFAPLHRSRNARGSESSLIPRSYPPDGPWYCQASNSTAWID